MNPEQLSVHQWNFRLACRNVVFFAAFAGFAVFLPLYAKHLGVPESIIGMGSLMGALSTFTFSTFFMAKLIRQLGDRRLHRLLWLGAGIAMSLLFVLQGSIAWVYPLIMAGLGVAFMPIMPLNDIAATTMVGERKPTYGLVRVSGSLSFMFTVLILGALVDQLGHRVIPIWMLTLAGIAQLSNGFFTYQRNLQTGQPGQKPALGFKRNAFTLVFPVLLTTVLLSASHSTYNNFGSLLLSERGLTGSQLSWVIATAVIAESVSFVLSGWIRIAFFPMLLIAGSLALVRWFLWLTEASYSVLLVSQVLHAVTFAAVQVSFMRYSQTLPDETRQFLISMYGGAAMQLLPGVIAFTVGMFIGTYHSQVFILSLILAFLSLLMALSQMWRGTQLKKAQVDA